MNEKHQKRKRMITMLKGGLVSIEAAMGSLRPMERRAAQYILEHPEKVVSLSVQKLAEYADVSEATIIRLSRSLQCKGFLNHRCQRNRIKKYGSTAPLVSLSNPFPIIILFLFKIR
jgi:hypothetical protein